MRTWTKSACVVLAWSILPVILVAAGPKGSVTLAQANTRTSSTSTRITSSTEIVFTSTLSVAAAPVTATSHTTKYVVKDGDTLAGIATRFAVRGGWPALYAANRQAIGPDPNIVHAGTVLVVPGQVAPFRLTVAAGDTLSALAAQFAVRGGDRHVEALGEGIDRGRAWRPGQVPRRREGVDGGTRQPASLGDLAVGPPLLAQPLLD